MPSPCLRCAVRLRRAAEAQSASAPGRAFFSTTSRRKRGIPTFAQTSSAGLDEVLASLRNKHFLPAALSNYERKLIFKPKNKQVLEEKPQTVTLGGEEIELKWIDRMRDIPSRKRLLPKAIDLMSKGEKSDWNNLPALLAGMHSAKITPNERQMGKIVRIAMNSGRFGAIMQCLRQANDTGMTLKNNDVLNGVVWGLHTMAQRDGWSHEATAKAIRDANEVAMQLEDEKHGSGKYVRVGDPRRRPEVLGVFLELAAVYAYKFQDRKDIDGKVKAFAERLLSNLSGAEKLESATPASRGPQFEVLRGISIWHGLQLAQRILGGDMPKAELAAQIVQDYEAGLTSLAEALETRKPKPGSYDGQALTAWRECIRE